MTDRDALAVVCLAGPTGSGKTAMALTLAEALNGEVINADSRQVYADFPIVTAQPAPEERARCPHHLYGFLPTDRKISAGQWAREALETVRGVLARGKTPLLVGGTGLYFQAILRGIAAVPPVDAAVSAELAERLEKEGSAVLHTELCRADPRYAARIHPNDKQRILRALEVLRSTGQPFSWWHAHAMSSPMCRGPLLVLNAALSVLTPRLARRIDQMLVAGALDEARQAFERCDNPGAPGWSGIGAAESLSHIMGHISLEECRRLWLKNTRAYAKRQLTWFRARAQARFIAPDDAAAALHLVARFREGEKSKR
ncbi:MAG: tRNA (adenosine(37)-N6)-dimethylallyltransferase MiaA [Desulfovibrio sp.]|nr:tRNA (adenosine(37)-N6)-dimethylallyltransferase MiaA [Desulfovibrio sp.]